MGKMTQSQGGAAAQSGQQAIEKGKCRRIHALVVNHQSGNTRGQGLVELLQKGVPAFAATGFLAGMQVDVGGQIDHSRDGRYLGVAVAGYGEKTELQQELHGALVETIPGGG